MSVITTEAPQTHIPITKPVFDDDEKAAVAAVFDSGWIVQGPRVARFEQLFAEFTGARHAVATSSCTTALHLALIAAGIGPADQVILPSFTFIATANAIEYVGAQPLFVDINLTTFTLDAQRLRELLEARNVRKDRRVRAIIPVSLFGLCAEMDQINSIAREHNLLVIEDAACATGAYRRSKHAGTEALAGCFSFHPRKAITTGEGGMIVTDDDQLASTVRKLRDHGASKTDLERHLTQGGSLLPEYSMLGYNYRMTDLQGALGVTQMAKLEYILAERRKAAQRYDRMLASLPEFQTPQSPPGYVHGYQSYVCLFQPYGPWADPQLDTDWKRIEAANRTRNRLMAHLEEQKISVRQGTHAVHTLRYYQSKYDLTDQAFPASYIADRLSLTLPLYVGITEADQERVVATIRSFLHAHH